MPVALLIGCLGIAALGSPATARWSPDGRWIAFVHEARPTVAPAPTGWVFDRVAPALVRRAEEPPSAYQLWAYRPSDGQAIALAEEAGPLSDPAWSRDGASLAFCRLVREADASARCEVVVQKGPKDLRVLHREAIAGPLPTPDAVRALTPDWSPDGRTLAAPLAAGGFLLLSVSDGRALRTVEDGRSPRWAPEVPTLAFLRGAEGSELMTFDLPSGKATRVAEVLRDRERLPGPFWSRDGQSLLVVRRGPSAPSGPRGPAPSEGLKLLRVRAENGQVESMIDLVHDPLGREGEDVGAWFADDPSSDATALVTRSPGRRPVQVTWCPSRPNEVQKRLNPFDESASLGALALSPGGLTLALSVGGAGGWSPPAICDLATDRLACVAPDDPIRSEWLAIILETLRPLLRDGLGPARLADGSPAERPSVLPAPGEFEPGDASASRIRRLARIGLPLVLAMTRPDPELQLAFGYLAEDYDAAMLGLEALIRRDPDPEQRGRLLAVKAQILLARREFDAVGPLVDHLRSTHAARRFAVQDDLGRPSLTPVVDERANWSRFLADRLASMRKVPLELGDVPDGAEDPGDFDPIRDEVPPRPAGGLQPF